MGYRDKEKDRAYRRKRYKDDEEYREKCLESSKRYNREISKKNRTQSSIPALKAWITRLELKTNKTKWEKDILIENKKELKEWLKKQRN